ncbi:DegQ family serine endoprotease [Prosthecobacter vanneervenii]|uniref:Serine protease Do n=1 Tax=Prosthecobacter vanneervenii TaxID=48466 RepID=A0A7W8DJA2_9BACT|nr:DegQ family serine endoprotease [Prosthecobacter vanneervenii]MBB5031877.1 serine protease Do [Prosthecobacter vanneervenii]
MKTSSSNQTLWKRTVVLGSVCVLSASLVAFTSAKDAAKPALHIQLNEAPLSASAHGFPSFAPVVKAVSPSVVKVAVSSKAKVSQMQMPEGFDLRRFFGPGFQMPEEFQQQGRHQRQQHMPREQGVGSGVIVTTDGYIMTNNHVVDGADIIKVNLTDGREFDGKVIGRDPKTDVAVIKVEATGLPAITFADSDKIEVGDMVLAVGHPFGIGQTVTTGIISAKGRATLGLDYEDFIQTDAAINPGNSGGALVDVEGRLIGMNTAILSRSGGNQGIGFAVPTNLARWVMESIVNHGHVERGFLGVNIQDLTPQLAKQFKMDGAKGALVSAVTPGSPADKAGVKSGDVITDFNGKAVTDSRHLKLQVGSTMPGAAVPMNVLRDGKSMSLSVTVKELPGDKVASAAPVSNDNEDALHGVGVSDLDKATREQLKLPSHIKGALISSVEEDSAAYEAGLREGDVILEINRQPVNDAEQATALCAKPETKVSLVKVWSHGGTRYVVVDESKAG